MQRSAAAVSSPSRGCEEALSSMRALRGGSEVFLNFEFCFFLAEAAGSAVAVSSFAYGCEEALSSTWFSSLAGTVFIFCFQFLSGRGTWKRCSCWPVFPWMQRSDSSTRLSSLTGSVSKFCFQFLSGNGIWLQRRAEFTMTLVAGAEI